MNGNVIAGICTALFIILIILGVNAYITDCVMRHQKGKR